MTTEQFLALVLVVVFLFALKVAFKEWKGK